MDMITRVAHAIEAAGIEWCENSDISDPGFSDVPEEVFARAAIEAMREPTREMIKAAWDTETTIGGNDSGLDPESAYQAMIDAALTPPTPEIHAGG